MEQRYQAVLAVIADGRGVGEVAAQFGVSRQSIHSWLRRYEDHGLEGLANRSHKPKSIPHQMPAHVEATVLELRREHRAWGPRRLVYERLKRGVEPVPSETGVYRALKRAGLIEPGGRCRRDSWRKMYHLGVRAENARKRVLMLIDDSTVSVTELTTGEVLSQHLIDPNQNYWPDKLKPAGRWPGTSERNRI